MLYINEGDESVLPFRISPDDMQVFCRLSGDRNSIHLDPAYARAHDLKEPIVYGGLLISMISQLLGMKLPGPGCLWQSLSIQFKAPLYVNESAELRASTSHINYDLRILKLKLSVWRQQELIAKGEAQVEFLEPLSSRPS